MESSQVNMESSDGIESNDVIMGCYENMDRKLARISLVQSQSTIYRVHKHLKDVNTKAYEPDVVAIGPYHRGKDNLQMMEDHKMRYLRLLLQDGNQDLGRYISAIEPLEQEARKSYSERISLDATEFIEMLVLDGCFIIQLVRKHNTSPLEERADPIFRMNWIWNSLQRDLMLFENQVPFFILCKLFDLIEGPNLHARLIFLLSDFLNSLFPKRVSYRTTRSLDEIKHLLDLMHGNWCPEEPAANRDSFKRWRPINHATVLRESNVRFEPIQGDSLFDITFKDGTMLLPSLIIEGRTESLFRNLMAYEQYFQLGCGYVTNYVKFLDCIIDSPGDVEILSRQGIIDNCLGDDKVVANMVNKLIESSDNTHIYTAYATLFLQVNDHCYIRRNRWMAKLRRDYLNSPWAIISIMFAVTLLLLTVIQSVSSIIQIKHTP
ncbi:hypothetical protein ACP275_07G087000 [Erythranthe tilingii]